MKRLTSEEIKVTNSLNEPEAAGVYTKKGKIVFTGTIEECVWFCKSKKNHNFTIQIIS